MCHPRRTLCPEVSLPLARYQRLDSTAQTCAAAVAGAATMWTPLLSAETKISRTTTRELVGL